MSKIRFILQVAVILLALAFTFACLSDGSETVTHGSQKYKTVKIGNQTWFAENLNYAVDGSRCYENLDSNCEKYGRLYDWSTAMTVCPNGWHLPSNAEWDDLFIYVEDDSDYAGSPYNSLTAGKHLKAKAGWNEGGNGTDKYGFSALPGGGSISDGFYDVGYGGRWWSSSENNNGYAYLRLMSCHRERAYWGEDVKSYQFSVRCLKD